MLILINEKVWDLPVIISFFVFFCLLDAFPVYIYYQIVLLYIIIPFQGS
jgi:hypothetical protein